MNYKEWISYNTYQIDENFSLEKADPELLGSYCEIYNQKLTHLKNIHYLPTLTNTYLSEVKKSYRHFKDLAFWIVKNGNRIGGILICPNSLQSFFMLEIYNNLEELSNAIFNLLLKISDLNNPIKTLLLNQEQTAIFKRLGFTTEDLYCNMQRPTEKFEITWEPEYIVVTPERQYIEELKKFHIAIFPELSEDILIDDADAYLKSYETDEILKQAALLIFNKSNELIANCMIWKSGDMPVIMATGVKEEYRNRGLATKMLKHALTVLHDHYPAIRLEVNIGSAAHRLYQNLGFITGANVEELSYFNQLAE